MISLLLGLALAVPPPAPTSDTAPTTTATAAPVRDEVWVQAGRTVQVTDRVAASKTMVAAAEKAGGWFSTMTDDSLTLRVPVAALPALLATADSLGRVTDRSYNSQDLSEQLLGLRTRLGSREQALARYLEVLRIAGADALVVVGEQVDQSIYEIESIKGQIQLLENRAAYAQLSLSYRFVDRSAPSPSGNSSFAWINEVNLSSLLYDFQYGTGGKGTAGVQLSLPESFARYPKAKQSAWLTADNVKLRVRSFRNKPKAALAFWEEALRVRMVAAGYHLLSEQTVQAEGGPLRLLSLGAPSGEADYSYTLGLAVDGNRLILVEVAGLAERMVAHQDEVTAALGKMSW